MSGEKGITARLESLTRAEALLPPRGFPTLVRLPEHVPIWYSLAMAHLASDDDAGAARWLERIAESTTERERLPVS